MIVALFITAAGQIVAKGSARGSTSGLTAINRAYDALMRLKHRPSAHLVVFKV